MQSVQEKTAVHLDKIPTPLDSSSFSSTESAFQQGVGEIAKVTVLEKDIDVFGDEHTIERVIDSTQYLSMWLNGGIGTGQSNSLRNRVMALQGIESVFVKREPTGSKPTQAQKAQACQVGMANANAPEATIRSQEKLNRAFGSNLIASGFNTSQSKRFRLDKPQLGTETARGTDGLKGTILGTPSKQSVQNSKQFADTLREAAGVEYQKVQTAQGDVQSVHQLDQLLHRGKLLLASASPERLRTHSEQTSKLIHLLVNLDHHVLHAQGLNPFQQRMANEVKSLISTLEIKPSVAS